MISSREDREYVKQHGRVALRRRQLVVVSLYLYGHRKPVLLEPAAPAVQGEADLWALARRTVNPSWLASSGGDVRDWILQGRDLGARLGPGKVRIRRQRETEEAIQRLLEREGLGVCRRCAYPTLSALGSEHTCKDGDPLVLSESWCRRGVELYRQEPL